MCIVDSISTATQEALTALDTTVTNQGTTLANKADASTLQNDYYTKTQVDNALTQRQNALNVTGNDDNATRGFKLVDSQGNLRSMRATNPYSDSIKNNTDRVSSRPTVVSAYGADSTNGMKLFNTTETPHITPQPLKTQAVVNLFH